MISKSFERKKGGFLPCQIATRHQVERLGMPRFKVLSGGHDDGSMMTLVPALVASASWPGHRIATNASPGRSRHFPCQRPGRGTTR